MAENQKGISRTEVSFRTDIAWFVAYLSFRIYRVWDRPVGPHLVAMFEVNIFTPAQFGAFVPWLVINRGPLSALVHPNHEDEDALRDHSQRATWLGERMPIDLMTLKKVQNKRASERAVNGKTE